MNLNLFYLYPDFSFKFFFRNQFMVIFRNNYDLLFTHLGNRSYKLQLSRHTKSILINIFKSIPRIYAKYNNRVYNKYTMQVKVFGEKALEIADGDVFKTTIEYVEGRKVAVLTRTKIGEIQ